MVVKAIICREKTGTTTTSLHIFNESIIRTVKLIKPYNIISTKMRQQALRKGILTVG